MEDNMTQESLRTVLSTIFGVDQKYIVPLQDNWWNPQEMDPTIGTWVAYRIENADPKTIPLLENDDSLTGPKVVSFKRKRIMLQFVGTMAETLADSISAWLLRQDVLDAFDAASCQLFSTGLGKYDVSPFIQDGLNSVLAYNTRFDVLWVQKLQATQQIIKTAAIGGTVE